MLSFGQGDPGAGAEPLTGFSFRHQGLCEAGGAAQPTFCQAVCPVQLPRTLSRGCSHALCWVRGSPGKVFWNAHVEARWWMGAWGRLCTSLILQVSPHSWESSGLASGGCGGWGVCAGSALLPPSVHCCGVRGLPGWHRVPLLLTDREKTPEQEAPNCCLNWSRGKMAQVGTVTCPELSP